MRIATLGLWAVLTCACASSQPTARDAVQWKGVKGGVELIVEDPSRDALYVRARGETSAIADGEGGSALWAIPPVDAVPGGALAQVTAVRGLRWLQPGKADARWQSGARPHDAFGADDLGLPPWAVVGGVVVETPLFGPGQGVPRPVWTPRAAPRLADGASSIADEPVPTPSPVVLSDRSLAAGRDGVVVLVADGGAHRLDLGTGELEALDLQGGRALDVRPAVGPGGEVFALAMSVPATTPPSPDHQPQAVLVGLPDGTRRVIPIPRVPRALHLAAGHVYVVVEEEGDRRLYRHEVRPWPRASLTAREAALVEHREGLLVGLQEHLAGKRLAQAVDWLDLLRVDGLLDAPRADEAALVQEVVALARPRVEEAARSAFLMGLPERAWAFDRRAVLLDGRRALPQEVTPPTLRLRLSTEGAGISAEEVAAFFERHPALDAREEPCEPGSAVTCLELVLRAPPYDPAKAQGLVDAQLQTLASEYLRRRAACEGDGRVLLDDTPGGPRAVFSCDLDHQVGPVGSQFAATLRARRRVSRPPLRVADVTWPDGSRETLEVPSSSSPLDAALDVALERLGDRSLAVARARGDRSVAEGAALRTVLWRGVAADEEARQATTGDGRLRPSWLGVVPAPLPVDEAPAP